MPTELPLVEVIPRSVLFGNPSRAMATLSRDGNRIAFLAPLEGVLNVWVAPVDAIEDAKPVTHDQERGISFYTWSYDADLLLYVQDSGGDENWHVYAVNLATSQITDLTPYDDVQARIQELSPRHPLEALIGLNDRDPRFHDVYRVNLITGESSCVTVNDIGATGFITDQDFEVRLAGVVLPDGGTDVMKPNGSGGWEPGIRIGQEDGLTTYPAGLDLVIYYTLPVGPTRCSPLPTVLLVHGGPWDRDSWGYDPDHQLLANRGYVVISVNFRGSTGFGKAFVNAGDREWGRRMHDDLIDAVEWAVAEGIADSERIAIMGGSYGGYATLVGLTFTPEVFACGVDIVGPSNLITMLDTIPPYWEPEAAMERVRIGDKTTEEGRAFRRERSPLTHVERISRPLLIGQGVNDPRVKQSESDQIVDAMTASAIPVTYVLYPDEGHGFVRPENNLSFMAVAEAFLAKCLGGRFEPIGGDFAGSSIDVVTGASEVPGLESALSSKSTK